MNKRHAIMRACHQVQWMFTRFLIVIVVVGYIQITEKAPWWFTAMVSVVLVGFCVLKISTNYSRIKRFHDRI